MYIEPTYQRGGLAEECFKESCSQAKKEGATVVEALIASDNFPARRMCKRLEFNSGADYQWMLKFS